MTNHPIRNSAEPTFARRRFLHAVGAAAGGVAAAGTVPGIASAGGTGGPGVDRWSCHGDAVTTLEASDSLTGDDSWQRTHELRADACRATVELDGPRDADIDLYVTLDGRTPTTADYDKRSTGRDAVEHVDLVPAELEDDTSVGILVRSYAGSGEFAVTVREETGHALPLTAQADLTGAVFSAPHEDVRDLLPAGLKPINATVSRAALTMFAVTYTDVAQPDALEPYREFGVQIPAVPESRSTIPYASVFNRGVSGYTWFLPVSNEPARDVGVDIWGFPKVVADIEHDDDGDTRRTTVTVDGEHFVTMEVGRPYTFSRSDSSYAYSTRDGTLLREYQEFDGQIGVMPGSWPFPDKVSFSFGDHPRARRLAEIDLKDRALMRLASEGEIRIYEGERMDARRDDRSGI